MKYMNFRVRACNKAVAGEFSEPVTLETRGGYWGGARCPSLLVPPVLPLPKRAWGPPPLGARRGRVTGADSGCPQRLCFGWMPARATRTCVWRSSAWSGTRRGARCRTSRRARRTARAGRPRPPTRRPGNVTPVSPRHRPPHRVTPAHLSVPVSVCPRVVQSPKRMPSGRGGRDRFTAESYTVLGESGGRPVAAGGAPGVRVGTGTRKGEGGPEGAGGGVGGHGAPRGTWRGWGRDGAPRGCSRRNRAPRPQGTR